MYLELLIHAPVITVPSRHTASVVHPHHPLDTWLLLSPRTHAWLLLCPLVLPFPLDAESPAASPLTSTDSRSCSQVGSITRMSLSSELISESQVLVPVGEVHKGSLRTRLCPLLPAEDSELGTGRS